MIVHILLTPLVPVKSLSLSHQQVVFWWNLLFLPKRVEKVDDNEILYIQLVVLINLSDILPIVTSASNAVIIESCIDYFPSY